MDVHAKKATRIQLFSFSTPAMRAFHMSWLAFFVCFFAWFAVAPLMPVIKLEFGLSVGQIANINIAAVGITILVRLLIGPLSDKYGPRRTYTALLVLGAVPVLGIAFAHSYEVFLVARLLIGAIGASFVITQYHTSVMFAPMGSICSRRAWLPGASVCWRCSRAHWAASSRTGWPASGVWTPVPSCCSC